jgi:hypothetical protein
VPRLQIVGFPAVTRESASQWLKKNQRSKFVKKTGVIENIKITHGELGQQYTTINGKVYYTWFDFMDGIREGVLVEYEEELNKRIASYPHPGNPDAGIFADVASKIRVIQKVSAQEQ